MNNQLCCSIIRLFGENYPCQREQGHEGIHEYRLTWTDRESEASFRRFICMNDQHDNTDYTKTELDGKYKWICDDPHCKYETDVMYDADTHQVQTDHSMTRYKLLK